MLIHIIKCNLTHSFLDQTSKGLPNSNPSPNPHRIVHHMAQWLWAFLWLICWTNPPSQLPQLFKVEANRQYSLVATAYGQSNVPFFVCSLDYHSKINQTDFSRVAWLLIWKLLDFKKIFQHYCCFLQYFPPFFVTMKAEKVQLNPFLLSEHLSVLQIPL